jgi:repressor LexA
MNNLKELRKKKRLTQAELANIIGISQNNYSYWENDKVKIDNASLKKLADFFGVSIDYILDRPESETNYPSEDMVSFPVIGYIRAGYGGEAIEQETGEIQLVPRSILMGHKPADFFVLQIKGDSMYPMFLEGDRVVIRKCDSVDSGSIAAILYNGNEATVKKVVYKMGEDWFDMIPTNPMFKTVRIKGPELQECRVLGLVVYLFRKIN